MTPSLTYDFNDYQILIYKEDDHVIIYAYDKQISTNFSKSFTNDDVMNLNMTLEIFYKIMVKVFEASYYKKEEKSALVITTHNNVIKLDIRHGHWIYMPKGYKFYSEFMFEVCLDKRYKFQKKNKLKNKDNRIKNKLKKEIDTLKSFINDYMEVTINDPFQIETDYNVRYSIKINTPIINIVNGHSNKLMLYQNNELDLPTYSQTKYNSNFKMIKCHTLKISNMININFNYCNLPESITTLIFIGEISKIHFIEIDLKNLETLILISCPYITTLYSSIKHLESLKNIRIVNCQGFIEKELFIDQGYNYYEYS